jgi:hypothetical protein
VDAIEEGLTERKLDKDKAKEELAAQEEEVEVKTKSETIEKFEEEEDEMAEKGKKDSRGVRVKTDGGESAKPQTGKRPRKIISKAKK